MSLNPKLIIFSILIIIGVVIYFTSRFFDNKDETVNISDIKHLSVSFQKNTLENIKEYVVKTVTKEELKHVMEQTKYIFLKPKEFKTNLKFDELVRETKETMTTTFKILLQKPINITIYWTVIVVLTMGFWDTFASTFLINFLDRVKPWLSFVLLGLIALPAFGLQETLWNLGKKIGVLYVAMTWLILSWSSLVLMWLFANAWAIVVLFLALLNSVGYAAAMSLGQMYFLDVYNKDYARYMNLKEIDANASAGPMKIVQNLANVFGLMFGWMILWLLDYQGFFLVFWVAMIGIAVWSFKNKSKVYL